MDSLIYYFHSNFIYWSYTWPLCSLAFESYTDTGRKKQSNVLGLFLYGAYSSVL